MRRTKAALDPAFLLNRGNVVEAPPAAFLPEGLADRTWGEFAFEPERNALVVSCRDEHLAASDGVDVTGLAQQGLRADKPAATAAVTWIGIGCDSPLRVRRGYHRRSKRYLAGQPVTGSDAAYFVTFANDRAGLDTRLAELSAHVHAECDRLLADHDRRLRERPRIEVGDPVLNSTFGLAMKEPFPAPCQFIASLYHYVATTGDLALAREVWPTCRFLIERCRDGQVHDTGLVAGNALWPDFPEAMGEDGHDVSSLNNSLLYQALRGMEYLAAALGEGGLAADCRDWAARLRASFVKHLYDEAKDEASRLGGRERRPRTDQPRVGDEGIRIDWPIRQYALAMG